ncbi:ferritin-like domain-containing protein [Falsiroseomonas sp. CW058]|uniref:ferritin-like domain-containing protein n=1 Tax=Falsiroseomonas sp. CW058 TaxID=3388664 RepID=UPI003D323849
MDEITKLMVDQLKDAHSAERQALRAMQRMMKNATNEKLKQGFEMHIEQTQGQVERLEQALEQLGAKAGRKVCEAMRGLVEEGQHEMEENDKGAKMDVVIIASAQRIEHYEISAYGTMATLAKSAGMRELGDLLGQTLDEEKRMDAELTRLAESEVNKAFIEEARAEMEEGANENKRGASRKKAS